VDIIRGFNNDLEINDDQLLIESIAFFAGISII